MFFLTLIPPHLFLVKNNLNSVKHVFKLVLIFFKTLTLIRPITTHTNKLREFHYDRERTNPIDIEVQSRGGFFIDSILEHRGDRQRRPTMEFKVRWLGYGPEHDSWEPYKNLAHTEQLILYLVRNRMRSLIPKGNWSNFAPIGKE